MATSNINPERPDILDNPRSDRVRRVASLSGRSARRRTGLVLVEGPQAVREALSSRAAQLGTEVQDVYLTEAAALQHADILLAATTRTRWVHYVSEEVSRAISSDSQGIACVVKQTPPQLETMSLADSQLVVVLTRIQDPGNVGTLIRLADAMGADAVISTVGTAEITSPKVIRSSAGSVFHIPVLADISFETAVAALRNDGITILGTSGAGAEDFDELLDQAEASPDAANQENEISSEAVLAGPVAWVFGNEANGLEPVEQDQCDRLIRIQMRGYAESLNVAAAAAICLSGTVRAQRKSAKSRKSAESHKSV